MKFVSQCKLTEDFINWFFKDRMNYIFHSLDSEEYITPIERWDFTNYGSWDGKVINTNCLINVKIRQDGEGVYTISIYFRSDCVQKKIKFTDDIDTILKYPPFVGVMHYLVGRGIKELGSKDIFYSIDAIYSKIQDKNTNEMNERMEKIEEKIDKIINMLMYAPPPSGSGYQEAKEDFESLVRE